MARIKRYDYEVTVTAPRMRASTVEVRAPNSAAARREARKAFKGSKPTKAKEARYSAHRKDG